MHKFNCLVPVFALTLLTFSGCGGGPADQPDLGSLTGTIKVDGQPKEGLEVTFEPESGRPSIGTTDASGNFEVRYTANEMGAKIGKGVIRVVEPEAGDGESYGAEGEQEDEGNDGSYGDENQSIPAQYNVEAPGNPEMNIEVEAGGTTFELDIKTAS